MTMNFSEDPNNYFIKTFSNLVKIKKPASTDNQQKHVTLFTYPVGGEWEYFFAHFRKGVKSFKKGLRMKFGYLEGQFIDFMEDSGG